MNVRATTRRRFLTAAAASAYSVFGADDRVKIASVKAYPIRVAGMAGGAVPKFTSDFDPARSRRRSEEHTSELQSRGHLVCRLLLEKKKKSRRRENESLKAHKIRHN